MTQQIINDLLKSATQKNASDVHLVVGRPPIFRIHGELFISGGEPFTLSQLQDILFSMFASHHRNPACEAGRVGWVGGFD
jgi:twitching motility protein PilT